MRERPILFSGEMIRALQRENDPKSQTRRILKIEHSDKFANFYPDDRLVKVRGGSVVGMDDAGLVWRPYAGSGVVQATAKELSAWCPHGGVGDRLWVKEAWRVGKPHDKKSPTKMWDGLKDTHQGVTVLYEAGGWRSVCPVERAELQYPDNEPMPSWAGRKRSSMFMPRWASRLTLEITDIRLQRLNDISEDDAKAEGVSLDCPVGHIPAYQKGPYAYCFAQLWNSINKVKHPWKKNEFVWCISFKRVV